MPRPPRQLLQPGYVTLESSNDLAREVASKSGLNVVPIGELHTGQGSSPVGVRTQPISLVGALGVVTAGPPVVGRSLLRMSGRWAIARYVWAFAMPSPVPGLGLPGPLIRLSDPTDDIRYHRRTLMSEDFGMAAGIHLIRDVLRGMGTRPVALECDVVLDRLVNSGHLVRRRARPGAPWKQPDLLLAGQPAGTPLLGVVECKGSSKRRSVLVPKLADGAHQAISVTGAAIPTRNFVIGAVAARAHKVLQLYAVEVIAEDRPTGETSEADATFEELRKLSRGDLLRFAGLSSNGHERAVERTVAPGIAAIGVENELPFEDADSLVLFCGLDTDYASAFADGREPGLEVTERLEGLARERGGLAATEFEALEAVPEADREDKRAGEAAVPARRHEWLGRLREMRAPPCVVPLIREDDPTLERGMGAISLDGVVIEIRSR